MPELNKSDKAEMIQSFDEERMQAHTISKLITSRKESSDVPEVQEKYDYPELALFA